MNKMSFEKLKELFLEKYSNGAIWKDKNRIIICYNKYGKGYSYCYTNHLELAKRLNLIDYNKVYGRTIEGLQNTITREKKRLEEVISGKDTFYLWTKEEEIASIENRIKELETELKESVVL